MLAAINRSPAISYAALTPNMQGYVSAVQQHSHLLTILVLP